MFETTYGETPNQRLERLSREMAMFQGTSGQARQSEFSLWDNIDLEISPLSFDQRNRLMTDPEYIKLQEGVKEILNNEFLKFMKPYVENNPTGRELLQKQLEYIKATKGKVISETNKEMELFRKFQEIVKDNPGLTWEEFLKTI